MMPDGNTAALRAHEATEARSQATFERASDARTGLVEDFFADERNRNQAKLLDVLSDLAGGDPEFLHAFQRGDLPRMRKLMLDAIDFAHGDKIVEDEAERIEANDDQPCRCRGDCTC